MNSSRGNKRPVRVLVVDDDHDDCLLIREAFEENQIQSKLDFVHDGEQLMCYLLRRPPYQSETGHPLPELILLDLNMPRMDGREALNEIRKDPQLCCIPVIVMSTSSSRQEIVQCYQSGASSFITKPVSYSALIDMVGILGKYWLDLVELPTLDQSLEI